MGVNGESGCAQHLPQRCETQEAAQSATGCPCNPLAASIVSGSGHSNTYRPNILMPYIHNRPALFHGITCAEV